jgi:SAM-dependent methyltransferase
MLRRVFANIGRSSEPVPPAAAPAPVPTPPRFHAPLDGTVRNVLDVGGGSKLIAIPPHYTGWGQLMLDIDANAKPDVLADARELAQLEPGLFDAVYCSHNLEHYYAHDVPRVLAGFAHVLKPEGFAEIRVPDVAAVARAMTEGGRDMEDVLYTSPAGPIMVRDVLYGLARAIQKTGVDFYAHKTGFTRRSLGDALRRAGFGAVYRLEPLAPFELRALALRSAPGAWLGELLCLAAPPEPL